MVLLADINNNKMDLNHAPPRVSKAMKVAIERGDIKTVNTLIANGDNVDMVDVNEETESQHSILIHAISKNQFSIAKLLLEKGARVDTLFLNYDKQNQCIYEITAETTARMLYEVSLDNNLGEVLCSIEKVLKTCQGREPKCVPPRNLPNDIPSQVIMFIRMYLFFIIDAIEEGDLFSVELLINHGVDVNTIQQDDVGNQASILIAAIAQWHKHIAKFLINRGAKVGTVFQNFNEENNKIFEVSALSIAHIRHKESPKAGMKDIVDSIEAMLRNAKGDAADIVTSSNVPNEMVQHSKITAWLHKPVPTIRVDESSDIDDVASIDENVTVNGNAKKYSTENCDGKSTSVQSADNSKQSDLTSTKNRTSDTNTVKDSKMCVIL
ncbi:uncharacterized protein [Amphiura filiformis]|uniref:uncharacterized protein n=1 Tax=Amphiura filiformis TaxID=82378 RepID=UPI003B21DA4F